MSAPRVTGASEPLAPRVERPGVFPALLSGSVLRSRLRATWLAVVSAAAARIWGRRVGARSRCTRCSPLVWARPPCGDGWSLPRASLSASFVLISVWPRGDTGLCAASKACSRFVLWRSPGALCCGKASLGITDAPSGSPSRRRRARRRVCDSGGRLPTTERAKRPPKHGARTRSQCCAHSGVSARPDRNEHKGNGQRGARQ